MSKFLYRLLGTFGQGFDTSIIEIPDKAANLVARGGPQSKIAIADALHLA